MMNPVTKLKVRIRNIWAVEKSFSTIFCHKRETNYIHTHFNQSMLPHNKNQQHE